MERPLYPAPTMGLYSQFKAMGPSLRFYARFKGACSVLLTGLEAPVSLPCPAMSSMEPLPQGVWKVQIGGLSSLLTPMEAVLGSCTASVVGARADSHDVLWHCGARPSMEPLA